MPCLPKYLNHYDHETINNGSVTVSGQLPNNLSNDQLDQDKGKINTIRKKDYHKRGWINNKRRQS